MTLSVPVLDHIVANVHQRMDEAQALYTRLGFALTARGYHTLGSINHLAIFATDYLELIALPENATGRQDLLAWPMGWNGVVFNTEDAAGLHADLAGRGVEASAPNDFSRPVELAEGVRDAVFRTVRMPNTTTVAGRLYWCQHRTRDVVWRDEWRLHPNGVVGIARVVYAAADPGRLLGVFAAMFGAAAVTGSVLPAGMATVEVVSQAEAVARYGAGDAAGRDEWIAAMEFRVLDLARTEAVLRAAGVAAVASPGRLLVPGEAAMGAAMVFISIP
jgi:hypothetical protein